MPGRRTNPNTIFDPLGTSRSSRGSTWRVVVAFFRSVVVAVEMQPSTCGVSVLFSIRWGPRGQRKGQSRVYVTCWCGVFPKCCCGGRNATIDLRGKCPRASFRQDRPAFRLGSRCNQLCNTLEIWLFTYHTTPPKALAVRSKGFMKNGCTVNGGFCHFGRMVRYKVEVTIYL